MKRYICVLALLLTLAPALARPTAMVVGLSGQVQVERGHSVEVGDLLQQASTLVVADHSSVRLIYFSDGHTEAMRGPLRVAVEATASTRLAGQGRLEVDRPPSRPGTHDELVDNLARMAGRADRGGPVSGWVPAQAAEISDLRVTCSDAGVQEVSWRGEGPGPLRVEVASVGEHGPEAPVFARTVLAPSDKTQWSLATPELALPPGHYVVRVARGDRLSEQRLGLLTPDDRRSWAAWRERLQAWARRSPEDPTPWRLQAGMAMSWCLMREALEALQEARSRCTDPATARVVEAEVAELQRELGGGP